MAYPISPKIKGAFARTHVGPGRPTTPPTGAGPRPARLPPATSTVNRVTPAPVSTLQGRADLTAGRKDQLCSPTPHITNGTGPGSRRLPEATQDAEPERTATATGDLPLGRAPRGRHPPTDSRDFPALPARRNTRAGSGSRETFAGGLIPTLPRRSTLRSP